MKADNLEVHRTLEALTAEKSVLQAQVSIFNSSPTFLLF
jgi:hypothetical protein